MKATTKEYTDAVRAAFDRYNDAIGFAYAINGTVQWVDVYASGELFRKLLPKLLDASAQEAIIELQKGKAFSAPSASRPSSSRSSSSGSTSTSATSPTASTS